MPIRECYIQFYTYTFDYLKHMNQFLENHNLPQLNQDQIDNLNSPITIKVIGLKTKSPEIEISRPRCICLRSLPHI